MTDLGPKLDEYLLAVDELRYASSQLSTENYNSEGLAFQLLDIARRVKGLHILWQEERDKNFTANTVVMSGVNPCREQAVNTDVAARNEVPRTPSQRVQDRSFIVHCLKTVLPELKVDPVWSLSQLLSYARDLVARLRTEAARSDELSMTWAKRFDERSNELVECKKQLESKQALLDAAQNQVRSAQKQYMTAKDEVKALQAAAKERSDKFQASANNLISGQQLDPLVATGIAMLREQVDNLRAENKSLQKQLDDERTPF
jgi:hypothetical protein